MPPSLPPVLYHYFRKPVPYQRALALQERIHEIQHAARTTPVPAPDVLLLLQHRPVYTAGRRQTEADLAPDAARLAALGADVFVTQRGGQLTYHGPGQLVGYTLFDLGRAARARADRDPGVRRFVGALQGALYAHAGLAPGGVPHTGVFADAHTKLASLGLAVRHGLTMHGFALNVTREPLPWFAHIVACGLADVRAGCLADLAPARASAGVEAEAHTLLDILQRRLERDILKLNLGATGAVQAAVRGAEDELDDDPTSWPMAPLAGLARPG